MQARTKAKEITSQQDQKQRYVKRFHQGQKQQYIKSMSARLKATVHQKYGKQG